jgi:hypothetical protein
MEGQVKRLPPVWYRAAVFVLALIGAPSGILIGQDKSPSLPGEAPEISLRKSVNTRQYQGREVEGEDRQIARGDTLWRILVEEKGLSGKQFRSYVVIIRDLNPQVKNLDFLRVGDRIFIPLRPGQLLEDRLPGEPRSAERSQPGATINYRVKAGEHLYQILRDQLKLTEDRKVAQYYALVRDLNPERKNWDALAEGEVIRLPVLGQPVGTPAIASAPVLDAKVGAETPARLVPKAEVDGKLIGAPKAAPETKAPAIADRREPLRSPANENIALLGKIAEAMGSQMQRTGEEVVALKDGAVRFDRSNYPVVFNPSLNQRVVLDPNDNIPGSLRTKLSDPNIGAPIVPMANGISVQDAVTQLLSGLGYQTMPADRPVVIHEEGITYEAKGNWMALAPEEANKTQEIYVISLREDGAEIPRYLRERLAKKGLHLKEVYLSPMATPASTDANIESKELSMQVKTWPRDKKEIVDSLLFAFGIPFGVAEVLSVELQNGLRVDARTDRVFELSGRRTALFFQRSDGEIIKALQEKMGVRMVELEIGSLSSRELIARLLNVLGDQVAYREHRFAAVSGSDPERLMVTAWGFHLPQRSLFITDRRIPTDLHRFFFEKGLEIVYFQ